jgi:lysophospholipase L1-like esterase
MMNFLQLGDSYTIGEGVDEDDRWGHQLVRALRNEGVAIALPHIVATTGWTTGDLQSRLDALEPLGETWDLVSLLMGVNNQYRALSLQEYVAEFERLLARAILYARGDVDRVFVLSIPDWGVTPFAREQKRDPQQIGEEIDQFNAAAREVCDRFAERFVDSTPASRRFGGEVDMLVADALHPSGAMYALWAAEALPVVRHMPSIEATL